MKGRFFLIVGALAFCGGAFGALTNGGEYVDQDWSVDMTIEMAKSDGSATNKVGFWKDVATNGVTPAVSGGVLTLTLEGATGGYTELKSSGLNDYVFSDALSYVATIRLKVVQFPDSMPMVDGSTGDVGINIIDFRGAKRAAVHLEPGSVWVRDASNKWRKVADVATAEGTYYTWQFEVDQQAGTMDILRRASDTDAWTVLATSAAIHSYDFADQLVVLATTYNGDNTEKQGIVESDYLKVGEAPFTPPETETPAPPADYQTWFEQNWTDNMDLWLVVTNSTTTNKVGFSTTTGTGGVAPGILEGKLTLSMAGATEGSTRLSSGSLSAYEFAATTNYIVTTRVKVTQFPDLNFTGSGTAGIVLFSIAGMDRASVHLEPDGVWVETSFNTWTNVSDIATAENTYYTWKCEISQEPGNQPLGGTMDIYRRVSDSDAWTTVATNVGIYGYGFTPQFRMFQIGYNPDNTQAQGVLVCDYLQMGYPSSATFELWASSFGLSGNDALRTADVEPDGMDNLLEYALGGDPTVEDTASVLPTYGMVGEGGTNWFEYVYNRRKDYADRGLEYNLETVSDLVYGTWTNANYSVVGVGSINADFESVSNRVDTGAADSTFIRLQVQEN